MRVDKAYHTPDHKPFPNRLEHRVGSRRTVIEVAIVAVPVIDLAYRLRGPDGGQRVGNRWVCLCPLPGHDERTPSFTVFLESNSWYCFGACQRGGDAVELAAAAWGYSEGETAMAAADLLHEFGHPYPSIRRVGFASRNGRSP